MSHCGTRSIHRQLSVKRYEHLGNATVREEIKRFDICRLAKKELEEARENVARYENDKNYQLRREAQRVDREINKWWDPVMICYERYRATAVSEDVIFCRDTDTWYYRQSLPTSCRWPEEP